MSADQLFLGIDSGTQGTKVIIFSTTQKKVISVGYAAHKLIENDEGKKDFVRIFFGCIAAVYFFLVLLKNVLGLNLPGLGN